MFALGIVIPTKLELENVQVLLDGVKNSMEQQPASVHALTTTSPRVPLGIIAVKVLPMLEVAVLSATMVPTTA